MILTVEVGGSSVQAILFQEHTPASAVSLAEYRSYPWLLAAPGLVEGDRIQGAHHLGWMDVQASQELHMDSKSLLSMNDAQAAALGEWWLSGQPKGSLLYIGLGTGVGAALVLDGELAEIEFSHLTSFGPKRCGGCGWIGCLDAQIGGHALSQPLTQEEIASMITLLADAIDQQDRSFDQVVIGGGVTKSFPVIVAGLQKRFTYPITPSACPTWYKSAAPYGLLYSWQLQKRIIETLPATSAPVSKEEQ